jgi:hypothetical protein
MAGHRLLMRSRPLRQPPAAIQDIPAEYPNLVEFEQAADRFRITLASLTQQPAALIQLFFFGMRGSASFHGSKPLLKWTGKHQASKLTGGQIIPCPCRFA